MTDNTASTAAAALLAGQLAAEAETIAFNEEPTFQELHDQEVAEEAAEMTAAAEEGIYAELEGDVSPRRRTELEGVLSTLYEDCMADAEKRVSSMEVARVEARRRRDAMTDADRQAEQDRSYRDTFDQLEGLFPVRLAA